MFHSLHIYRLVSGKSSTVQNRISPPKKNYFLFVLQCPSFSVLPLLAIQSEETHLCLVKRKRALTQMLKKNCPGVFILSLSLLLFFTFSTPSFTMTLHRVTTPNEEILKLSFLIKKQKKNALSYKSLCDGIVFLGPGWLIWMLVLPSDTISVSCLWSSRSGARRASVSTERWMCDGNEWLNKSNRSCIPQ